MQAVRVAGWVVVVAAAMAVAGCSDGAGTTLSDPASTPSSTPSANPASPAARTESAPSVPGAVVDRMPVAARAATPAGAQAFVDFYIESINTAYQRPSAAALEGLSTASCDICAALASRAEQFENTGQHYAGPIYRPGSSTASADGPSQKVVVDIEQFGGHPRP